MSRTSNRSARLRSSPKSEEELSRIIVEQVSRLIAAIGMDIFLRAAKNTVQPADVRRVARCTRSGGNEQVAAGNIMATVA